MRKGIVFIILVILSIVSLMSLVSDHIDEVDSETNIVEGWFDKSGKSVSKDSESAVGFWEFDGSSGVLRVRMNTLDSSLEPSLTPGKNIPLPWSKNYDKSKVKTIYLENWTKVIMCDYGGTMTSAFKNLESFFCTQQWNIQGWPLSKCH